MTGKPRRPQVLVPAGPRPGWALLHLGATVAGGSAWMLAAFAAATWQVHRCLRVRLALLTVASYT